MDWKIQARGPRVVIEAWRENTGEGLYKAYVVGARGRILLGTMAPENGRLYLQRTVSIDSLQRQGAWPILRLEDKLAFPFQNDLASIEWPDEVLRNSARHMTRCTMHKREDGFELRFPFDGRSPFPLLPIFCFARLEGGQLLYTFQKNGKPYISRPAGKNM